jgi:ESCRT-II complex subunit VPS22
MSHRRGGKVGIGRVAGTSTFSKKAEEIQTQSLQAAVSTLEQLQRKLEDFANTYQKELQQDPAFRHKFFQMCAPLGIDAFCSTRKGGFWKRLFSDTHGGDLDDFYNELSVKVAEICIASRSMNGGIMSISEVSDILRRRKRSFHVWNKPNPSHESTSSGTNLYSHNEIIAAVEKLSSLGTMKTITVGNGIFIVSVPAELDQDHFEVLTLAQAKADSHGQVTLNDIIQQTRWGRERALRAINLLLSEGMAWLDVHQDTTYYWFPRYDLCRT